MPDKSKASVNTQRASWARLTLQALRPALRMLSRPSNLVQFPRLVTEGVAPVRRLLIQAHNQREITRLIQSGSRINFISSFARSGNTWTRNLLADALLQANGIKTDTDLPVPYQEVVPDFYCESVVRRSTSIQSKGILVKTHDTYDQLCERFCAPSGSEAEIENLCDSAFRNSRIVYLFRSPEDVLVSYFHLQRKVKYIAHSPFGIDEFCRSNLPHWMDNMSSYLKAESRGVSIFFASYEGMLREPASVLSEILRWLEIPHDAGIVERAVAHMQFANLRAREERASPGTTEYALRRGRAGAGLEELQPQTRCEIREESAPLLKRAHKLVARQSSAPRTVLPLFKPGKAAPAEAAARSKLLQPV